MIASREIMKSPLIALLALCTTLAQAIEVQGHRGARALRPENTLAAFEYALQVGVDVLEMDLGVTSDNVLVVVHDSDINPWICSGPKTKFLQRFFSFMERPLVHEMTLAEIKQYDCGSHFNPKFWNQVRVPGAKIPTLSEVFEMVESSDLPNAKTVAFNIEMKSEPTIPRAQPLPEDFARLLLATLNQHKMLERSTIQSFDHRTLKAAKAQNPQAVISVLTEKEMGIDYATVADLGNGLQAEILSPNFEEITNEDVQAAHGRGLKVIPWTANKAKEWQTLIDKNVDGIITDDPAALIAYLQEKKLR